TSWLERGNAIAVFLWLAAGANVISYFVRSNRDPWGWTGVVCDYRESIGFPFVMWEECWGMYSASWWAVLGNVLLAIVGGFIFSARCAKFVPVVWPSLLLGAIVLTAITSLLDRPYHGPSWVLTSIARSFVLIFGQFSAFVTLRVCITVSHRLNALAADVAAEQEEEEASADRPGTDAEGS
ncbi:MAG: hypothetical protein ACC628_28350, partial [Pirellulaceae bacterium]